MKISEINLSDYDYKRINIIGKHHIFFSKESEDILMRDYGDCEVSEVVLQESGWLDINIID